VVQVQGDDYFVFMVSDANFDRYDIRPSDLSKALTSEAKVIIHRNSAERVQISLRAFFLSQHSNTKIL
jgi:DNA replication initiation complex subunit (GINS family)